MPKLLQMPLLFDLHKPLQAPVPAPEPPQETTPDAPQRANALDIRRSWIVEAPAGSGKTGLLTQRFLKLLAHGHLDQPNQVLALTFTRKADAEMRRRILAQLTAAAQNTPLPPTASPFDLTTRQLALAALDRDRNLDWRLLDNPQQLNIRTIDSLCAELATSLPLLAAGPTAARLAPTADPDPLYDLAARRTLLLMGGPDSTLTADLESLLLHRDARPADFTRLLAGMLRGREQWGELVPLDPVQLTDEALDQQVRPRLTRTLERLLAHELQTAANRIGEPLLHDLAALAHTLTPCPGYNGNPNPLTPCAANPNPPEPTAANLPHWHALANLLLTGDGGWRTGFNKNHLGFEVNPFQKQQLKELIDSFRAQEILHPDLRDILCNLRELPPTPYPNDQWQTVKSLCRVLRHALLELQLVFAERRACDFTEVALTARALLRQNPEAPPQTSIAGLQHLLVDEMQDTSAAQYELLETLTHGWDGLTQTIFLVGDPKQSIYEFRQARVERFLRIMSTGRLGQLPLGALRLTANFRSQATLVADFNTTFRQILPTPEALAQTPDSPDVPFIAATHTRDPGPSPALLWHFDEISPTTPALQARALRDLIETHLANHPPQKKAPTIAVLARGRAHLAPILHEFHQDRGHGPLPFRAVDIEPLADRPEILDLLSLTRALLHPADRPAWLALLRSPACGLGLADLLTLTGEGPTADRNATLPQLIATRTPQLTPLGQQLLARAWPILQRAIEDLGRTPLATHVERTWRSLGGDAPLQTHELTNAHRFLDLLHELETGPDPLSLTLLARRLRSLYAQPDPTPAAVELMTIHKAKGLEWDLVLIPALHRGSGRDAHEFLKWLEFDSPDNSTDSGPADLLLAPIQSKGDEIPTLSSWLNRFQTQRKAAEAKRLLYVACTRARESLHLFAALDRNKDNSLTKPQESSLLHAAWPAAAPLAAQQLQPAAPPIGTIIPFAAPSAPTPEPLALAAAAEPEPTSPLRRFSLNFNPLDRFAAPATPLLAYPAASQLPHQATFTRPEGSFAARAFGNVVHRFLALLAQRLAAGQPLPALTAELPSWRARLHTALRAEGIPPNLAATGAHRALVALQNSLRDPTGAWLLSPHADARSEAPLPGTLRQPLRADRTFRAGPHPGSTDAPTHLWIIDYKTTELGGRDQTTFLADQKANYLPQLQTYADAAIVAGQDRQTIVLALYFPILPAIVSWPAYNSRN